MWRGIQTREDKSQKIGNEEVDCVAFCEKKRKGDRIEWRNTEVSSNKYRKREEKQNIYAILKSIYEDMTEKEMH